MGKSRSRSRSGKSGGRTTARRRISRAAARAAVDRAARSLREAENQAADKALEDAAAGAGKDGGTRLMQAINQQPMPVTTTSVSAARVDVLDYKNTTDIYVNGDRVGSYDAGIGWALTQTLRSVAKTGVITLAETDLSQLNHGY